MTERGTAWSYTVNNPTSQELATMKEVVLAHPGWAIEGQLEKGKSGTEHYQAYLKTTKVSFSTLKKLFPRAHIERCRNITALKQYVHKADTRLQLVPSASSPQIYTPFSLTPVIIEGVLEDFKREILAGLLPHRLVVDLLIKTIDNHAREMLDNDPRTAMKRDVAADTFMRRAKIVAERMIEAGAPVHFAFANPAFVNPIRMFWRALLKGNTDRRTDGHPLEVWEEVPAENAANEYTNGGDGSDEASDTSQASGDEEADEVGDGSQSDEDAESGSDGSSEGSGTDEDISAATDSSAD